MVRRNRKSGRGGKPSKRRWDERREEKRKRELTPGARYPGDPWDDQGWRFVKYISLILFLIMGIIAIWGLSNN